MIRNKTTLPAYSHSEFQALLQKHQATFNEAWALGYARTIAQLASKELPVPKSSFEIELRVNNHYLRAGYHDFTSERDLVAQYAAILGMLAALHSTN